MNIKVDFKFTLSADNRLVLTPSDANTVSIAGLELRPSEENGSEDAQEPEDELATTRQRAEQGDVEVQYSLREMTAE